MLGGLEFRLQGVQALRGFRTAFRPARVLDRGISFLCSVWVQEWKAVGVYRSRVSSV